MAKPEAHYHGHRKRLRERFQQSGLAGFAEHEVIELLLTLAIPRLDVKQPAKALLKQFGSLRGVLDAPLTELQSVKGIGAWALMLSWSSRNGAAEPICRCSGSTVGYMVKRGIDSWEHGDEA